MKRIGVLLSGCGVMDGSEIHEAVLTLYNIDRLGGHVVCLAPDMDQADVVNHRESEPVAAERRNVLVESARIARGRVRDIAGIKANELDALILPGGFGAAKNLCTFADQGADCKVHPEVSRLVKEMNQADKPLGFLCIAPVLAAKVFSGSFKALLTIGHDKGTAQVIESLGHQHQQCAAQDCCIDREHKIVTAPAYMEAQIIKEAAAGIEKLAEAVMDMARDEGEEVTA